MSAAPPPEGSPTAQKTTEVSRPRAHRGLTVSFDDQDEPNSASHVSRLQYEVAECVETKTITTTTTTKRSFPPVFIRQPRALESLDTKEYPLASGPTPPDLRKFSVDLTEHDNELAWSLLSSDSSFPCSESQVRSGLVKAHALAWWYTVLTSPSSQIPSSSMRASSPYLIVAPRLPSLRVTLVRSPPNRPRTRYADTPPMRSSKDPAARPAVNPRQSCPEATQPPLMSPKACGGPSHTGPGTVLLGNLHNIW